MLLHKGTAAEWEAPFSPRTPSVSEGAALLALVMELTGELSIAPRVYRLESEPSLWVHFPAACFDCRNFLEEYGGAMSYIHGRYPIAVYGTAEDGESAELSAVRTARNTILYKKRNLSQKDFDCLSDLCVKIGIPDPRLMPVLEDTLRHIVPGRSIVAVPRTPCTAALFGGLPEMNPDTAFAYFNLNRDSDAADPLDVLSVEQKKTLWLLFLEDGVSAVEFADLLEPAERGEVPLFTWELALRLALDTAGIRVAYEPAGFQVAGPGGTRLRFDYLTGSPAEKLFLKILFPVRMGPDGFPG